MPRGAWNDVRALRALGVNYVNTSSGKIYVSVSVYGLSRSVVALFVDGIAVALNDSAGPDTMVGVGGTMFSVVPPGSSYRVSVIGGRAPAIVYWAEFF